MAAFLQDGVRDLGRRLRIAWLWLQRHRTGRALYLAEAELGWLGWEQTEFYDEAVAAEVKKIQEFEDAQAALLNTNAELSGRKAALDEELAREKEKHDKAVAILESGKASLLTELRQVEARRRLKYEAVTRFEKAMEELSALEKNLEARSHSYLAITNPSLQTRVNAREVSDELSRVSGEKKLVGADKLAALRDAAATEPELSRLRTELNRIETASSEARDGLAAATKRLAAEMHLVDRNHRSSNIHIGKLDREKKAPYRNIGACLADHAIAPMNQPVILEKVITLRARKEELTGLITEYNALCAAADYTILIPFYLLAAALLFILIAIISHYL